MTHQSISGFKGTPILSAPEVLQNNEFSKAIHRYSFAFVVFEIMSSEKPFSEIENASQIFNEVVVKGRRPKSNKKIPQSYAKLIEKCWSDDLSERPTFEGIVFYLKMNSEFITNEINNDDYQRYIEFIDDQIVQEAPQMIIESENVWFIYYLFSQKYSFHFL